MFVLTSCTQDPPTPVDPDPTPSASTSSPEASDTPEPTPSPTTDAPSDEATASDEPSDGATPDDTSSEASGGDDTTPTDPATTSAAQPLGSWTQSPSSSSGSNPDFVKVAAVTRNAVVEGACKVAAGASETINKCVSVWNTSHDGFLSVVDATDGAGVHTVRVYRQTDTQMVATLEAAGPVGDLKGSDWPSGDNVVLAAVNGSERMIVAWDASAAEPTIAAHLGWPLGGESVYFAAGKIIKELDELGGGDLQILTPGVTSSNGKKVGYSTSDPAPTVIALRVYRAWISGNYAGMQGMASDKAIAAFKKNPVSHDVFTLSGNACTLSSTKATCTFSSSGGNSTWTLERHDGKVQVVALS